MTGFFGVFSPRGRGGNTAFEEMQKTFEVDDVLRLVTHVDDHIALGHLKTSCDNCLPDTQPVRSSCGRYLLTGHFRLDYRDELGDKLGLTQSELLRTADPSLAMLSFQKWNDKCVLHLDGDWSFVLYDTTLNKIFLFRDPCGYSSLFYCTYNSQVYFSTDPSVFFTLNSFKVKIDFDQLYKLSLSGGTIEDGKTLLSDVFAVKSSSIIEISNSCQASYSSYQAILIRKIRYKFINDYTLLLKSKLANAILERLKNGRVGVFQSGGYDSSTLSYFISKELLYRNLTFKTFTSFPKYLAFYSQEKQKKIREDDQVNDLLSAHKNCSPFYLNFSDEHFSSLFDHKKSSNIINPVTSVNSFWVDGIIRKAKSEGVQILFAGKMGNYTFSWNAPFLGGSYFYKFKWKNFYRYCKTLSQTSSRPIIKVAIKEVWAPVSIHCQALYRKIRDIYLGRINSSSVLSINTAKKNGFSFLAKSTRFHPAYTGFMFPDKLRKHIFYSNVDQLGQRSYLDSYNNAISITDPYSDRKFIEFSFGIPECLYNKFGDQKFIAKEFLADLYSNVELNIRSGVPQAYDIGIRLKRDFDLDSLLTQFKQNPKFIELFDEAKIRNLYASIRDKETNVNDMLKAQELLKALSVIAFYFYVERQNA